MWRLWVEELPWTVRSLGTGARTCGVLGGQRGKGSTKVVEAMEMLEPVPQGAPGGVKPMGEGSLKCGDQAS